MFPNTNIITELSQATSIRFMQFCVNSSHYAKQDSKLQKVSILTKVKPLFTPCTDSMNRRLTLVKLKKSLGYDCTHKFFFSPCDFEVLYSIEYAREIYIYFDWSILTCMQLKNRWKNWYIYMFIRCIPINLLYEFYWIRLWMGRWVRLSPTFSASHLQRDRFLVLACSTVSSIRWENWWRTWFQSQLLWFLCYLGWPNNSKYIHVLQL